MYNYIHQQCRINHYHTNITDNCITMSSRMANLESDSVNQIHEQIQIKNAAPLASWSARNVALHLDRMYC